MSEIFDGVRLAADSLVLDGEAAWEAALSAVEELGAWEFESYKPKRPGPCMLDRASYDEILRQHARVGSVSSLGKLLDSREGPDKRLGFSPSHLVARRRDP